MTVATLVAGSAGALAASAQASSGNSATRWVQRTLDAVRSGGSSVHAGTPGAGRVYAMTTAAMYDAVNGINVAAGSSTRDSAVIGSYAGAPADGNRDAAASAAAHAVLSALFGSSVARDQALASELAALGSDPSVEAGRAWGASVGSDVVALRSADGTQQGESLPGGQGAGVFPRNFGATQFRHMAPFGISSTAPYRSAGPPPLTSAEYAQDLGEVKAIGSRTDTNAERTAISRHWLAEGGTVRETGLWFKAALSVAEHQGTVASLSDTTRLFALLGMATADAVKTSWSDKYAWQYWRPGDAVRQADADGNPATDGDPTWNPRGGTCAIGANLSSCSAFGGTPEHTSGTSTFAGASSTVLAGFYCTDRVAFTFTGEQPGSAPRSYDGFAEAAREAGRSRIYGGIHFQFSNDDGREAGRGIGAEILRTQLRPAGSGPGSSDACKAR